MHNEGRLFSQVAAEAGVPTEKAMIACYLLNLSREGKTLDEAATLLRKQRCEAREYARDWGIAFSDYMTSPQPLSLTWAKAKRGRWELSLDGLLIAVATSDGRCDGGYTARRESQSLECSGSSAEIAIRRLSTELEKQSVEVFGLDDVRIWMDDAGQLDLLAPQAAADPAKLRRALAAS